MNIYSIKIILKKSVLAIVSAVILFLVLMTLLELNSMYKTHEMKEIVYEPVSPKIWPGKKWSVTTPEEMGMDSEMLVAMAEDYRKRHRDNKDVLIDSITIIRNNHIVADLYFNPLFPPDTRHVINSCTKSIMSTLIGIAIDKGYIVNVNEPLLSLLKIPVTDDMDPKLKSLTLKHLLTMQTGWHSQDSYLYEWRGLFETQATNDWPKHILNLPFETEPGTRFDYSNLASHMLSEIITKSTGMDTLTFARKHLFDPLGISDLQWDKSPQGIYVGWARIWLKPHDMAKMGLLYLQKGRWQNAQVVSSGWVDESIRAHSFPQQYRYIYNADGNIDFGKSGGGWISTNLIRPLSDGYGYQWWLDESGMYSAVGFGGQFITVVPDKNLIVVVTSKLKGTNSFYPVELIKEYVLPSIKSDTSLPANNKAHNKLISLSLPGQSTKKTRAVTELSATADRISGMTYSLEPSVALNPWQNDNLKLVFDAGKNHAGFSYTFKNGKKVNIKIGLDNVYRLTKVKGDTYAAIGEWTDPDTFTIHYELIGYSAKGQWQLKFLGDQIMVHEEGVTGAYSYSGSKL